MKIKTTTKSYEEVCNIEHPKHVQPVKQWSVIRRLLKFVSKGELKNVGFTYEEIGMEKLGKDEPCLILMNHSSFTDLFIVASLFVDRQYHIVCTNDGFVGKESLMRRIGCIPTKKFITDTTLVKDMKYTFETLKSSVVMYPEASYSFDGTETPLPKSLSKCLRLMKVPVVMVKTDGGFIRDPLYNNLQKRDVKVSAKVKYVLSAEDVVKKDAEEIHQILCDEFKYDHFRSQYNQGILVKEKFRADGLHRVLYKCPACKAEGNMIGKGITISCKKCHKTYTLEENGSLSADKGDTEFRFVPDWYAWEREEVRRELETDTYRMDMDVDIKMLVDMKSFYSVGEGRLVHDKEGFTLTGCDDKLKFTMANKTSYSLYADYYWYEIGDVISIGDSKKQFYCFPKDQKSANVAKARLATEEAFKMAK